MDKWANRKRQQMLALEDPMQIQQGSEEKGLLSVPSCLSWSSSSQVSRAEGGTE